MSGKLIEIQLIIFSSNGMESIKCPCVLQRRIYCSYLLMKFRGCNLVNSKENIQVGYRNSSRIVNWYCVSKTSLNYGADTNLSFIVAYELHIRIYCSKLQMKFRDCTKMNSTENIQKGYRNGLWKTAVEFENCKQQSFTLTMCLSACLWAQIAKTLFNYYQFQRLILQFPALGKNYGIASMFILTRGLRTPRDVERRERGSMFWDELFLEVRTSRVESMKTALKSTITK